MRTYGFGIVGCGMISHFHARALGEVPNARLVAGAEPVEERRKEFAEKYGCEGMADYKEMVRRDDIDVVCVCTPSGAHLEPALAAAKAGKHVIVEKPLEITLERCDEIIRVCEENGVRLCGIYTYRYTKGGRALKAAIEAGRFGRITLGDAYNKWWRTQEYYDGGAWRGTWELDGGGACMNQGIHAIDLIQWFMGPVDTVTAFSDCLVHERVEVEDTAVAAIRYKSGAMGVIECTTSVHPGFARMIEIHGDQGTVMMENELFSKWEFAEKRPEDEEIRARLNVDTGKTPAGVADPGTISHVNFREEIKDFLGALETGRPTSVDGLEARKAVELITAIYESARRGEAVRLPLEG